MEHRKRIRKGNEKICIAESMGTEKLLYAAHQLIVSHSPKVMTYISREKKAAW